MHPGGRRTAAVDNKRYKSKICKINELADEKIRELLFTALDLVMDGTQVQKTRQAYFIGIIDNVLFV